MDITMVQFNDLFKKYMTDVKILEKTHPSEAVKLWLKICQFIVDFAKTPNCPRTLRPKLITQAEAILIKVKYYQSGRISTVFNPEEAPNAPISTSTRIPPSIEVQSEQSLDQTTNDDESMFSQLMALPDIPQNESDSSSPSVAPSSQAPPSSVSPSISATPASLSSQIDSSSGSTTPSPADMSRLAKLEKELRQMPTNFKEITPTPYVPQNVIPTSPPGVIPPLNPDMYKDNLTTLDITKESDVGKTTNIDPGKPASSLPHKSPSVKIGGFLPDPFSPPISSSPKSFMESLKNAPPAPPPVDPFGPRNLPETDLDSENLRLCFACGSTLKPNSQICPQCGSENP